jgi:hypothetical protein
LVKLHIRDKSYPWKTSDEIPIIHMIRLQREVGVGQNELRTMSRETQALQDKYEADLEIAEKNGTELPDEPPVDPFMFGIKVWLARLTAGEKIGFEEACDFSPSEMRFEVEPGDPGYKEVEQVDPTQDAEKPRKSSAKSQRHVEAVA